MKMVNKMKDPCVSLYIDLFQLHAFSKSKYKNNPDPHNRNFAFENMLKEIMLQQGKDELCARDSAFKASQTQSMQRMFDKYTGIPKR